MLNHTSDPRKASCKATGRAIKRAVARSCICVRRTHSTRTKVGTPKGFRANPTSRTATTDTNTLCATQEETSPTHKDRYTDMGR